MNISWIKYNEWISFDIIKLDSLLQSSYNWHSELNVMKCQQTVFELWVNFQSAAANYNSLKVQLCYNDVSLISSVWLWESEQSYLMK